MRQFKADGSAATVTILLSDFPDAGQRTFECLP